ncbi:hypothetical protein [Cryptosporangium sp. NPDC048952]
MTISLELLTDRRCPFDRLDGAACPGTSGCVGRTDFTENDPGTPASL